MGTLGGMKPEEFPIEAIRADFTGALDAGCRRWVMAAPTGSGKSTQVPQWLEGRLGQDSEQQVVVLQPRRLAARLLAGWVAHTRGERVGETVGYQVRFDQKVTARTRIRYVTEGLLLRQLMADPSLRGVGAVILDEFHERHLFGDITLARLLDLQQGERPDLVLGLMSATLDLEELAEWLAPCARFTSEGRTYPVETAHATGEAADPRIPVWERARLGLREVIGRGWPGDVLVFMAGVYEIRKTLTAMRQDSRLRGYDFLPLYGDLSPAEQDRAVSGPGARPKCIIATNVAETSITIEGVGVVIDAGQARVERYDPRRGINTLLVEPISQASADQRAGRAGRTGPGRCLRLWREREHAGRRRFLEPEIARVDLSEMILFLKAGGVEAPLELPWFTPPPADSYARGLELLKDLGALDSKTEGLTPTGRKMAQFPLHPRFSRMLVYGEEADCATTMALLAAVVQGRSLLTPLPDRARENRRLEVLGGPDTEKSDFFLHLAAWYYARKENFSAQACRELGIHAGAARQAGQVARQILGIFQEMGVDPREDYDLDEAVVRKGLLLGFPDHVAIRLDRGTRRCRVVHDRTAELSPRSEVGDAALLVAAEIEEVHRKGGVAIQLNLVTAIEPEWLETLFPDAFSEGEQVCWDPERREVAAVRERRFLDLVLASEPAELPDPGAAAEMLAREIFAGNLVLKSWDEGVERWIRRVNFLAARRPDLGISPVDDEARLMLLSSLCEGATAYREVKNRDIRPVLKTWIPAGMEAWMDCLVPEEVSLPRRKRPVRLRYEDTGEVVLAATIQDFYDVPGKDLCILEGEHPLKLELLAPNRRPIQVMDATGLDAFWTTSYPEIRKELKGRYPKHEWREDC